MSILKENCKKLVIKGTNSIHIENMNIEGSHPRKIDGNNINYTVQLDSPSISVINCDCSAMSDGYNIFELPYSVNSKPIVKAEFINCKFGPKPMHQPISLYNFADGAEIIVKGCEFDLNRNSNPIRLDNIGFAHNVTITIENCNWTYSNGGELTDYYIPWLALILFENGSKSNSGELIFDYDTYGWKLIVKDCTYNSEPVLPEESIINSINNTIDSNKAVLCLADDYDSTLNDGIVPYDDEHKGYFPQLSIIYGDSTMTWTPEE